jgi:hypothetical protein
MRTEDEADDLDDGDDLDDEMCHRQKPRRRHCMTWHKVGDYVVIGCSHCPKVKRSWLALTGDSEKVSESQRTHDEMCVRLVPWLVIPAQRTQRTPAAILRSAGRTPSRSGR